MFSPIKSFIDAVRPLIFSIYGMQAVQSKPAPQESPGDKFLRLVAEGEQDEAEAVLKKNQDLALVPANVTDLSGRTFNNITGFQYALWALDWHMWSMIKKYMSEDDIKAQVAEFDKGSWTNIHGVSANWENLVDALNEQVRLIKAKKWGEVETQWQQQVGGAQRLLPAHVVNEYCHPQ